MRSIQQILMAAAVLAAASASAGVIYVYPGPGTPLQDAIDVAAPGDILRLAAATYTEAVRIDKPLWLSGPRTTVAEPAGAVIDAGCAAPTALEIDADDVRIQRIAVKGATFSTISVDGHTKVALRQVTALESVFGCGGVQYGINLFDTTDVRLRECDVIGDNNGYTGAIGYHDAGIYIGGIPAGGNVRVKKGFVVGNNRGIIIEDSLPDAVRILRVGLPSNATGIFVHNSDGARIERNVVNDALGSGTTVGLEVDATSDDNLISRNTFVDAATDVIDAGTSNCWTGNVFVSGTVPSGGCD